MSCRPPPPAPTAAAIASVFPQPAAAGTQPRRASASAVAMSGAIAPGGYGGEFHAEIGPGDLRQDLTDQGSKLLAGFDLLEGLRLLGGHAKRLADSRFIY